MPTGAVPTDFLNRRFKVNITVSNTISDDIKSLYAKNQTVAALLDILATKKRKRDVISVKYACQLTGIDYDDMEEALRALDAIKVGVFTNAYRDNYARLTWRFHPKSLAEAATGRGLPEELDVSEVEEVEDDEAANAAAPGDVRHDYLLRPDRRIVLTLPLDLTHREAERLGQFIQSLPLEASY
jgi:hypothetical protein